MTAKSVIQVAVDDSQFRAFYDLYHEYQEHLESAPEDWRRTGDAINDAGSAMQDFAEATGSSKEAMLIAATQAEIISKEIRKASEVNKVLLEGIWKNTRAQKDFSDEAERSNESLKKMKENAEGVAGSVFGIGKWLLKLGAWGAGLAGLGGLLSGIGLKDLASSAVDTQRSARGLGMTPGQLTAFNQDFGSRYLDEGTLGSIANAQNSFAGRMWLARASGEGVNQVASDDPGQLAGRLAIRAHEWWANTPENMRTSENLQAAGFTQSGFSLAMMRQLGNTPISELQRASAQYGHDQGRFNVSDRNTDAWYGFLRQLKDAGNTIETDLKNKLVALSGPLEHFVEVIGKDAMKLIDEILTPANLNAMEDGINKLTEYLGSKEFGEDVKTFAAAVAELASDAKSLVGIFDKIIHPFGGGENPNTPSLGVAAATGGLDSPLFGGGDATAANQFMSNATGNIRSGTSSATKKIWGWMMDYLGGKDNAAISGSISRSGRDIESALSMGMSDVVAAQAMVESGGNPRAVSPKGAQGLLQFTPETAATLGLKNAFDPVQSIDAAVRYDNRLLKRYGGDVRKALAAYNWGPNNLDKDIAKNGASWEQHLPAETKAYLNKIAALLSQKQKLNVTVTNNTSARVAVQANAAAAQ